MPVEQIPTGPGKTSLAKDEIVISFFLPARPPHSGDAYQRFTPRTEMDIAVVGVGVNLTLDNGGTCTAARVALGAVAPTVLLVEGGADALIGTKVDDAALEQLAAAASAACRPIDDKRGTKEYRIKIAGVLAKRTAQQALERGEEELMAKKYHVTTTINGDDYEFLCEPQQTLLDVLRDELQLTGTKEGCVDRRLRRLHRHGRRPPGLLLPGARGRGRGQDDRDHRGHGQGRRAASAAAASSSSSTASQCGICTPGILIAARALLERNPDPTETEIRYWLAGNLCRCTGYDKIIRSVQAAAKEMRGA